MVTLRNGLSDSDSPPFYLFILNNSRLLRTPFRRTKLKFKSTGVSPVIMSCLLLFALLSTIILFLFVLFQPSLAFLFLKNILLLLLRLVSFLLNCLNYVLTRSFLLLFSLDFTSRFFILVLCISISQHNSVPSNSGIIQILLDLIFSEDIHQEPLYPDALINAILNRIKVFYSFFRFHLQ